MKTVYFLLNLPQKQLAMRGSSHTYGITSTRKFHYGDSMWESKTNLSASNGEGYHCDHFPSMLTDISNSNPGYAHHLRAVSDVLQG